MEQIKPVPGTFFSLTHYAVHKFHIPGQSLCDKRSGRATASIYYLVNGAAEFSTPKGELRFNPGEVLYIPRRQRYTAKWTGTPDIVFYGIDFGFELKSEFGAIGSYAGIHDSYVLQKPDISGLCGIPETFDKLYLRYCNPESTGLEAVMDFYSFFGELLPHLDKTYIRFADNPCEKAASYIEENCTEDFYAEELAEMCGLSLSNFYSLFKKYTGLTPVEYKNTYRVRMAQQLLLQNKSIDEITERLNFSSPAYFRKVFKSVTGMLPGTYKKNASGYGGASVLI